MMDIDEIKTKIINWVNNVIAAKYSKDFKLFYPLVP